MEVLCAILYVWTIRPTARRAIWPPDCARIALTLAASNRPAARALFFANYQALTRVFPSILVSRFFFAWDTNRWPIHNKKGRLQPEPRRVLSLEESVCQTKPAVVYLKSLTKSGTGFFVTETGVTTPAIAVHNAVC
jgi:hypothetical protein